jgi:hypothetical protein
LPENKSSFIMLQAVPATAAKGMLCLVQAALGFAVLGDRKMGMANGLMSAPM